MANDDPQTAREVTIPVRGGRYDYILVRPDGTSTRLDVTDSDLAAGHHTAALRDGERVVEIALSSTSDPDLDPARGQAKKPIPFRCFGACPDDPREKGRSRRTQPSALSIACHSSSAGSQPTESRTKPGSTASPQRARRSAELWTPPKEVAGWMSGQAPMKRSASSADDSVSPIRKPKRRIWRRASACAP